VFGRQSHGLSGISTLENNVLTPQIACIKNIQEHEYSGANPLNNIRDRILIDTRMIHRN
jgi:hypothetical protein